MEPVKIATCRAQPGADGIAADRAAATLLEDLAPDSMSWARFGERVVFAGEGEAWSRFAVAAGRAGLAPQEHPGLTDRQRLHVVVQKGRLFQQEHPDVPVLSDSGRFLLVDMNPQQARDAASDDVPCYAVRPLDALEPAGASGRSRIVFDVRSPATQRAAARAVDPAVQALVDRVSRAGFEADLVRLVGFPTRFSTSVHYAAACDFVEQRLAALGYATARQRFEVDGSPTMNIVARRKGTASAARGTVVVTAHLDAFNHEGGPASPAPGADDNASGSAGVLEIARALRDHRGANDLCFVLFGGEEQGLFGSKRFVASMAAPDRARVRAVPAVLLEGAALSQAVIEGLATAAATYTELAVQTSLNPFNSDHVPFIRAGMPAVLTIEGADSANDAIHSERDTLDRVHVDLALEILRMNTAFVAESLGDP